MHEACRHAQRLVAVQGHYVISLLLTQVECAQFRPRMTQGLLDQATEAYFETQLQREGRFDQRSFGYGQNVEFAISRLSCGAFTGPGGSMKMLRMN